jgi:phosphate starvation-inducible PhoH-like protein
LSSDAHFDFPDLTSFAAVCGPNDRNLLYMERLLGRPLFPSGTRISVREAGDGDVRLFSTMMDELLKHQLRGEDIGKGVIDSLYNSIADDPDRVQELHRRSIDIPQGYSRIFPRTYNQSVFLDALDNNDLIFGIGPAGTGKTFLAVAHALSEVLSHKKRKLILTRPVVEAGESLGFLPGDLAQKLNPYLKPLYDAMDALVPGEIINRLEMNRTIEIAPLAYMRGRSLRDAYIILDEAQNTTREQMKMFLTRLGEDSKAVITGDVTQIDLPKHGASGLIHATKLLQSVDDIHFSYFAAKDVVRSPLVKKIIAAYERDE